MERHDPLVPPPGDDGDDALRFFGRRPPSTGGGYAAAMTLVVLAVLLIGVLLFLHSCSTAMDSHREPGVLRALRTDRMASYRPEGVVRTISSSVTDASTGPGNYLTDASILHFYAVPANAGTRALLAAQAAARAAGWRFDELAHAGAARLPGRDVGGPVLGSLTAKKSRADGTDAELHIELSSRNDYLDDDAGKRIALGRGNAMLSISLDSGRAFVQPALPASAGRPVRNG